MAKKLSTVERIKRILNDIERQKAIVIVSRDKMRAHFEELESLLESFDDGVESIENGKREIQSGLDQISTMI